MKFKFISSLAFLILMSSAHAENPFHTKKENCIIISKSEYFNGETKENINSFKFKTKKQCLKMKETLGVNFSPTEIKKVTVKMDWNSK